MDGGLYQALKKKGWLIPHEEMKDVKPAKSEICFRIIKPERIGFISYPYEWSFSQLKDAALLTLKIQKAGTREGDDLKDASAYNIQFHHGKPVLIDTLSFDDYTEGKPWDAYRQFCQHFLAPLALMSRVDIRLIQLMRVYIDGIPLDLAAKSASVEFKIQPGTHDTYCMCTRMPRKNTLKPKKMTRRRQLSQN